MRKERFGHSGPAWAALALCTTLFFCPSCSSPTRPAVTSTPSVQLTATALAPTPAPTPTPLAVLRVVELHIDQLDFLAPFARSTRPVYQADFQAQNPAALLLTPQGSAEQHGVQFLKDGQTWILGNWNLPMYAENSGNSVHFNDEEFRTPNFQQLMGMEDRDGNLFYHVPLEEGKEGMAPAVFMRGNELKFGLFDQNGVLVEDSEKDYWQKMPEGAVKAVMAKFENAIYVTFYDKDGNQLVDKRIKVCDLPEEVTPTPEATETPKSPGKVEVIDNFEGARIWVVDQARLDKAKDYFFQETFGKTTGVVDTLLPRHNIDQPSYHNIPVQIDLSEGIKMIYHDIEKMTPEEELKYKEGIVIYSKVKVRYDVGSEGCFIAEVFLNKPISTGTFGANAASALQQFLAGPEINIIAYPKLGSEIFRIIVGDLPLTMGGKVENFNPCIQASFE